MIEYEVLLDIYDGAKEIKHNKILFWTALKRVFPSLCCFCIYIWCCLGGFGLRP